MPRNKYKRLNNFTKGATNLIKRLRILSAVQYWMVLFELGVQVYQISQRRREVIIIALRIKCSYLIWEKMLKKGWRLGGKNSVEKVCLLANFWSNSNEILMNICYVNNFQKSFLRVTHSIHIRHDDMFVGILNSMVRSLMSCKTFMRIVTRFRF